MIDIFAHGIVTDVRFAKRDLAITLEIASSGRMTPQSVVCRVTGKLAVRLRHQIKLGEELVVHGTPRTHIMEIATNSVMKPGFVLQQEGPVSG